MPESSSNTIFRVGHPPLWNPPDWHYACADGAFGNRFDDPLGQYRVIYASSGKGACFAEILDHFRVNPALSAALGAMEEPEDHIPAGVIPPGFFTRVVGRARISAHFADICHSEWLCRLRSSTRLHNLDASHLQSGERTLTQAVSRTVHDDAAAFDGIRYLSRLGHDFQNQAIFDRSAIRPHGDEARILRNDPDLLMTLALLGLSLPA